MTTTLDSRVLRRHGLIWLAIVVGLAGVSGVIWATGGFDSNARPYMGPAVGLGELVETRFWNFEVHGAEVVRERGMVAVDLTVTNKLPESQASLTGSVVMVRLEGGEILFRNYCRIHDRGSFGPFLPTRAVCQFEFGGNEVPEPPAGDLPVTILLLDQEMTEELLLPEQPTGSQAAGHVELIAVEVLPEEEA